MLNRSSWFAASLMAAPWLAPPAAAEEKAFEFPPVTAEEKALSQVPGHPNTPAVVLWRKGEVRYSFSFELGVTAHVRESTRIKVLTSAGQSYGEREFWHLRGRRLLVFTGRTVTATGKVRELPASSVFEREVSDKKQIRLTRIALSDVDIGSILDTYCEYEVDTFPRFEPWTFQEKVPTLYSEVIFSVPKSIRTEPWLSDPEHVGIHQEITASKKSNHTRVWATNTSPPTDEPLSPPSNERVAKFTLIPRWYVGSTGSSLELYTWGFVAKLIRDSLHRELNGPFVDAIERAGVLPVKGTNQIEATRQLFTFVRDEIRTLKIGTPILADELDLSRALSERAGTAVEKALLLDALLTHAGIDSVWLLGASGRLGTIEEGLPTGYHLDQILVAAQVGDSRVVLDPSNPCLGFSQLPTDVQGKRLLAIFPRRGFHAFYSLPHHSAESSWRKLHLVLALDQTGRLTGRGTLSVAGHYAFRACEDLANQGGTPAEWWRRWLEKHMPDFEINEVQARHGDTHKLQEITWTLGLHEEDQLEAEIVLLPSRPFGPYQQMLHQLPRDRRTAVLQPYLGSEELELELTWPEGWSLDASPQATSSALESAEISMNIDHNEAEGTLVYRRRIETKLPLIQGRDAYTSVQQLYAELEKSDAQPIVLVRR